MYIVFITYLYFAFTACCPFTCRFSLYCCINILSRWDMIILWLWVQQHSSSFIINTFMPCDILFNVTFLLQFSFLYIFYLPLQGGCKQCVEEEDELCPAVWPPSQNIPQPTCQCPSLLTAGFSSTSQQCSDWHQHHRQILTHPLSPFVWRFQPGLLDCLSHQGHHGDVQVNKWHVSYK